ncbi:MAG TPA: hypothetical protein DEA71_00115 [Nitrospira sp.]|nr:hypothetical protein [Nitrospira sp.]
MISQSETNDSRVCIVAIHGVGDRKPGAVLDAVLRGLSHQGEIHSQASGMYCSGHCYRQAEVRGHRDVSSVIEVNWDDISHPARSPIEHLTHFFSILASTLRHGATSMDGHGQHTWPLEAYRWTFNALLLWCVYFPVVTIAGQIPSVLGQAVWIVGTGGIVAFLAKVLSSYDRGFSAGWAWAAGVLLVGLASVVGDQSRDVALSLATWTYGGIQGLAGLALLVAMGVTWLRSRTARPEQRLARLAFLYLPFALFTGIGALVWACTLAIVNVTLPDESFKSWSSSYVSRLTYDLAFSETLIAIGVAGGGILLLWPAAHVLLRDNGGESVHARLLTALRVFPLIVIAVFGLYVAHIAVFWHALGTPVRYPAFEEWIRPVLSWLGIPLSPDTGPDVFQIYLASSLRLVPFLVYLGGPGRVILDTVGDVLLYVDQGGHLGRGKVRERCQQRLLAVLNQVVEMDQTRAVLVLAHSQGTAICADVLAKRQWKNMVFVSMGSPIGSLYWRFLGPETVAAPAVPWLNFFRTGDYIAGGAGIRSAWAPPIDLKDRNLGAGRHSNYFEDPRVWETVGKLCSPRQKSESDFAMCIIPEGSCVDDTPDKI